MMQLKILYSFVTPDLAKLVSRRQGEDNPNLSALADVLSTEIVEKGKDSRGIIFVRTRALAEALKMWLSRCGIKSLQDLNAQVFTGTNASEDEGGEGFRHFLNKCSFFSAFI